MKDLMQIKSEYYGNTPKINLTDDKNNLLNMFEYSLFLYKQGIDYINELVDNVEDKNILMYEVTQFIQFIAIDKGICNNINGYIAPGTKNKEESKETFEYFYSIYLKRHKPINKMDYVCMTPYEILYPYINVSANKPFLYEISKEKCILLLGMLISSFKTRIKYLESFIIEYSTNMDFYS